MRIMRMRLTVLLTVVGLGLPAALHVELRAFRRGLCRTYGVARVGPQRVVRAELTSVLRPADGPAR